MSDKTFYAVVDLETTGSQPKKGDRIIQFGCVLIQDGHIAQRFETKINPMKKIPENIQHLTGITNRMVANEPLFNDVAGFIWNLLQDCVFVAHNVLFDFRFLNEELKKAGYPKLEVPALDTVELSQILFPTEESYSLPDITESLGYDHEDPHDALEDAEATASLFMNLVEKVKTLPLVTIEELIRLSPHLSLETGLFFEKARDYLKDHSVDLSEEWIIVEGIALRRHSSLADVSYREQKQYPFEAEEKNQLFNGSVSVRPDQEEMMDTLYQYFTQKDPGYHLAIEAPSGMGKTLGYLLPSVFLASKEEPVVISTYTTLLQQQLLEKDLERLKPYLPFPVPTAVLKSRSRYLSLVRFHDKLYSKTMDKMDALYSSKVLVWLTETDIGDMDELGVQNDPHSFWNDVRTRAAPEGLREHRWEEYDFYHLSRKRVAEASLIITNHSFLSHDSLKESSELPKAKKVIIDEAHQLPKASTDAAQKRFYIRQVKIILQKIGSKDHTHSFIQRLSSLLNKKNMPVKNFDLLETNRLYLETELDEWMEQWSFELREKVKSLEEKQDQIDVSIDVSRLSMVVRKQAKTILLLIDEIMYILDRTLEELLAAEQKWTREEQVTLEDTFVVLDQLTEQSNVLRRMLDKAKEDGLYWIRYYKKDPHGTFHVIRYEPETKIFLDEVLGEVPHVVYTSSTLAVNHHFTFFKRQLGSNELKTIQLESPYNYQKQARIWIPEDLETIKGLSKQQYVDMLTRYITEISLQTSENMLVLFNSLETLEAVYAQVQQAGFLKGRDVFAQGLSGSRDRILKRFFRSSGAILLGADSFWEGIDLPGKSLRLVVVTRLPFESPDRPLVKARQNMLKSQQRNPFTEDSLPRAAIKLKQGFGRLIRTSSDKGIFFVLDDRFLHSGYAQTIQKALPEEVPIERIDMKKLSEKMHHFFDE